MIFNNKIILHIPEQAWINDKLQDIPIRKLIDILTVRLQDAGFHSFYITRVKSFYKGRSYPEKLITLYCADEYEKVIDIFSDWFIENNNLLRQEAFAYEYNNSLCIKELDQN